MPIFLASKKILALDLSLIVAGTKYRGQFEERLKGIIRELRENPDLIIFIDEIHSLIGAGSAEGSLDAANILKPALSRGEVSCIGATTLKEYRKYIEKDRSLLRRFQAIQVDRAVRERDASRSSRASRIATSSSTRCATPPRRSRRPSTSPTATSPTASSRTRRSTSSTRPAPR